VKSDGAAHHPADGQNSGTGQGRRSSSAARSRGSWNRPAIPRLAEQRGLVIKSGRGLYIPADSLITELHTFAEAARRVPKGVICLLSALRFHDVGTQNPFEIWMAIGEKDRRPRSDNPKLRIVRFSKDSLEFGKETHMIEGVPTHVFSVAKTVADSSTGTRSGSMWHWKLSANASEIERQPSPISGRLPGSCRVANVMKPYVEALT
jgi:hypothetical protein